MTKDTIIDAPTTPVAEYTPIAAALAAARARYQDVVWDLTTTRGNEEARRARRELVSLRTGLEARRKELKAPLLAQAKLVDDEAKRITAELLQLEEPIDELIRADERRREEERAAREAAERARVAGIRERIAAIVAQPVTAARIRSSALLRTAIDTLAAQEVDDSFEEFAGEARAAHAQSLDARDAGRDRGAGGRSGSAARGARSTGARGSGSGGASGRTGAHRPRSAGGRASPRSRRARRG